MVVETPLPPRPKWEELSADEQKPYLDIVIKLFYEKQLKDPTAYNLTRQQVAMRTFAVQNKQFFLEDLTPDEVDMVQSIAKKNYENGVLTSKDETNISQNSSNHQHGKSKTGFVLRGVHIAVSILCAVSFVLALTFSLLSSGTSPWMYVFYIIGFISIFVAIGFGNAKQEYCKKCGCKGVVYDKDTQEYDKFERKHVTDAEARWTQDGHVSYDKDGNAYVEQVKHYKLTTYYMECPCCGDKWKVKRVFK